MRVGDLWGGVVPDGGGDPTADSGELLWSCALAADGRLVAAVEAHKPELRAACGHLREEGATVGQIAAVVGVSAQAVHKYWLPAS